jgi:hypothetical protein
MRRLSVFVLALGLMVMVTPAQAQPEFDPHPHMLILGLELDEFGEPVGFAKCVDLAAGQALPNNAQHDHLHVGTAGFNLFTKAGHVVVPGAPFPEPFDDPLPWSNCEELIDFFFGA